MRDAVNWTMTKRTYVDTCVLLVAFKLDERDPTWRRAMEVLGDPDRTIVVSDEVKLETLPKARFYKQDKEIAFYREIFDHAENLGWSVDALRNAIELASTYDIEPADAVHVAHAIEAHVDEFVSAEKPTKPMFRVTAIPMRSLRAPTA